MRALTPTERRVLTDVASPVLLHLTAADEAVLPDLLERGCAWVDPWGVVRITTLGQLALRVAVPCAA